ncbi:MAG: hypothetical protein M1460_01875 [Candidatus Thermoplasmatota archaeon]|nr:hypothetical protein [Candidatus Thermoplasmatota archaeon]
MDYKLLYGEENRNSVFNLRIKNREGEIRETPSRAFKKVSFNFDKKYFTELMISIKNDELKGKPNYAKFDENIERKLKKKEVKNNVNIISFYGDKNTDINNLVKFEDLGLLSNFETLFNDHLITMPYSLSLYDSSLDEIYQQVTNSFDTFFTTLTSKNLFGYVPAYVKYGEIDKFINFYSGKSLGTVNENETKYNAIPLLIDLKRSAPDSFMRSIAMLHQLKIKYMAEGYYPIYYAANVSRPRTSDKKQRTLAKEFMLAFLGFDIIGASHAVHPKEGKGGGGEGNFFDFDLGTFSYIKTGNKGNTYKTDKSKAEIFSTQTSYLNLIHNNTLTDTKYLENEFNKRKEAKDYVDTINGQ